ncbi:hypothetical protein J7M28_05545 [bacterium]|nr:hypothetical protein [bacterium]
MGRFFAVESICGTECEVVFSCLEPATIYIAAGTYSALTNGEAFPLQMRSNVSLTAAGADTTILDWMRRLLPTTSSIAATWPISQLRVSR